MGVSLTVHDGTFRCGRDRPAGIHVHSSGTREGSCPKTGFHPAGGISRRGLHAPQTRTGGGSARCGSKTVESARPDLAAGGQGISVFDFLCPALSVGTRVQAMAGILRKERGKTVAPGRKRRDEKEDIPDGVCSEMACRGKAERPVLIVRPVVIPFSIDRSEREEGFFLSVF